MEYSSWIPDSMSLWHFAFTRCYYYYYCALYCVWLPHPLYYTFSLSLSLIAIFQHSAPPRSTIHTFVRQGHTILGSRRRNQGGDAKKNGWHMWTVFFSVGVSWKCNSGLNSIYTLISRTIIWGLEILYIPVSLLCHTLRVRVLYTALPHSRVHYGRWRSISVKVFRPYAWLEWKKLYRFK